MEINLLRNTRLLIKKILFTYGIMLCLFLFLIIGVYCIPQSWIKKNVITSERLIQKEGLYPQAFNFTFFMFDNYTDALMFNLAISADEDHPIQSAMKNPIYMGSEGIAVAGEQVAKNELEGLSVFNYGRYWQGHQVLLRPILIFMNYAGIRILNYILLTSLVVWCFMLMCKKISRSVAVLFLISLVLINFPIVPYSMQFSMCFYILLLAMIALLRIPTLTASLHSTICTFFVIGGVTSYLDFLTTPQLTLGFPLIVYMLQKGETNKKLVILLSFFWALGYGGIWISKWCVGSIFTGTNFFIDALKAVQYRSFGEFGMSNLVSIYYILGLFLILACIILIFIYKKAGKGIESYKSHVYLLLIALIVPVWFCIIRNHTIEHIWFTWRALLLTVYSGLLFMYYTIDFKKINIRNNG